MEEMIRSLNLDTLGYVWPKKPKDKVEEAGCQFVAQLQIPESPKKLFLTAGSVALLHTDSFIEECMIIEMLHKIDPKTRKPIRKKLVFVTNGAVFLCRIQVKVPICIIEKLSKFPQLGLFTLRNAGNITLADGKVIDIASTSAISSSDLAYKKQAE